jgi:hypothetical protein
LTGNGTALGRTLIAGCFENLNFRLQFFFKRV